MTIARAKTIKSADGKTADDLMRKIVCAHHSQMPACGMPDQKQAAFMT